MSYQANLILYGQQDTGKRTISQLIPSTFDFNIKNQENKKYVIQINKICLENVLQYNKQCQQIKMNKLPLSIIFTYSVADNQSYNFIKQQYELIKVEPETQIILLGTKTDLPREVTLEQGKQLKQEIKASIFYEVETKTRNSSINDFMLLMYKKLNKRMNENQEILDKCLINLDVLKKEQDEMQFSQIIKEQQEQTQYKPLAALVVYKDKDIYRQFMQKILSESNIFTVKSDKYNLQFDVIFTDRLDYDNYICQVLLYNLQNNEDFQYLQNYMQESHDYSVKQNVLLGINLDEEQRMISLGEGKQFKQQIGALFYEVSLDEDQMNWDLFVKNLQIKLINAFRNIVEHQQLEKYTTQKSQQHQEFIHQSASQQILQDKQIPEQVSQQIMSYDAKKEQVIQQEPPIQIQQTEKQENILQQNVQQQYAEQQQKEEKVEEQQLEKSETREQEQQTDIQEEEKQKYQYHEEQTQTYQEDDAQLPPQYQPQQISKQQSKKTVNEQPSEIPNIELPHAILEQNNNFTSALNSSDLYQQHSKIYNPYAHDLYNQSRMQDSFQVDSFLNKPQQTLTAQQRLAQQIVNASKNTMILPTQSRLQQKYHVNVEDKNTYQLPIQSEYNVDSTDLMNAGQKLTATRSLITAQRALKKIQREKIVTKATAPLTESMKLTKTPVLVLELDINNKIYQLPLCKNDDFYVKAKEFVQKNELDSKMIKQIAMLAVERMNNYLEQEKQEYLQQKRSVYQTQKFYTPQFNRVRQIKDKQPPLFKFELEIGRRKAMIAVREENKDHPEILADQFIRLTQVDRNQYYGIIVAKIQEMISLYEMQQDGIE